MVIRDMPPFWATFNPSDLRSPIVLSLAGVAIGCSESITSAFCHATATMNPVPVATFFHEICRGIFNHLLRVRSSVGGFFGPVSAYFGPVETNSRGMLHLYCLVLLKEISSFSDLCKKIAGEDQFKTRLLSFLDQVIRCELTPVDTNQVLPEVKPLTLTANDASVFASQLNDDANLVTSRVQMHSRTHNATFFKYGRNKTQCRFNFPRPMIPNSHIDNTGSISLRRNNVWVNP